MILPRFTYHDPADLAQAVKLVGRLKSSARLLAGGTDLLVQMKRGLIKPDHVINLARLKELRFVVQERDTIRIGALATAAELATLELGPGGVVSAGAAALGSPPIRERATIGGNLVNARPAADFAPPLLAAGAWVVLRSRRGQRQVKLAEFFTGPGTTVMAPDELLTEVCLPRPVERVGAAYQKQGARRALEISLVSAAAFLRLDERGYVKEARVALGAVAPRPIVAASAARLVEGEKPAGPNDPIFAGAGLVAADDATPIDDHRGSAEYRRLLVDVLVRRALGQAWLKAQGGSR